MLRKNDRKEWGRLRFPLLAYLNIIVDGKNIFVFICFSILALPYQEFTKGPPALSPGRFREVRNIRQGHGCR